MCVTVLAEKPRIISLVCDFYGIIEYWYFPCLGDWVYWVCKHFPSTHTYRMSCILCKITRGLYRVRVSKHLCEGLCPSIAALSTLFHQRQPGKFGGVVCQLEFIPLAENLSPETPECLRLPVVLSDTIIWEPREDCHLPTWSR